MADFDTIKQEINVNIPDNNSQYITAKKVRDTLLDMIDDVDEAKQDTLVSGTNIKTINGYTLLGSGDIIIEGGGDLSAYVSKEELSQMGYVTSNYLSQASYVTNEYLSQASYVTQNDLSNAGYLTSIPSEYVTQSQLSANSYVTETELSNMSYATTSQLSGKQDTLVSGTNIKTINNESLLGSGNIVIEGGGDLSAYVSKVELSNMGYITASDVSQMGYVTSTALTNMSYVTQTDLSNAGYLTSIPSEYVTETEIAGMGYVTATELSNMGYITASDLPDMSSYATLTYLETYYATLQNVSDTANTMQQVLIDANIITFDPETGDMTVEEMATETYVADYVSEHAPMPDLSAYVTKTELSNMSYVTQSALNNMSYVTASALSNMGYLTSIPSEYVTESELSAMSYATTTQLATKQDALVSGTNIKTINNNSLLGSGDITITGGSSISEVTQAEYDAMEQGGTLDPDIIYVITDAAPTDLSYYVLQSDLESMGYVTSTALSNMSYATTTQVNAKQDTLVSGTNIKTINNESLLGSGNIIIQGGSGEANVIESISVNGTTQTVTNKNVDITVPTNTNQLTNGAGFLTSSNFIYDSSTNTLTISI